jgi:hypothetical protein
VYEIAGFYKTEVMWVDTEYIVHEHPFVFTDSFPDVRRLNPVRASNRRFPTVSTEATGSTRVG